MKMRFKLLAAGLITLLCMAFGFQSQASHLAAADMHIDHVPGAASPYTYLVTLNVYRACERGSAPLGTSATLRWQSISGCATGGSGDMGLPKIDTLDQLCDTFKAYNACRFPTDTIALARFPAFVRHTWTLQVTLPGPCPDWQFWWYDGNRNSGILNLQSPGGTFLFVDALINNSKKANVNTPRYTIAPIPYFCALNKVSVPNGPMDPDLDSMVSTSVQPRTNTTVPWPYNPIPYSCPGAPAYCYSASDPIASDPSYPYYMDPTTGTATFQPTIIGRFVLAFKTYDYDRITGEVMGYTTRDVQTAVLGCIAAPPDIDTVPSNLAGSYYDLGTKVLYACPGNNLRFDLSGVSTSTSNKIYARWDLSPLPGATYTTVGDGSGKVTATLNWVPTKADVGTHTLKLRFVDSTCSLAQALVTNSYYVLNIQVLPYVDAGKDGIYCVPGGLPWQMRTKLEPGMRYQWSTISGSPSAPPFMDDDTLARPKVTPNMLTNYLVEGSIFRGPYRCTTRDTVQVRVGTPIVSVSAGKEDTVCANEDYILKGSVDPISSLNTSSIRWTPSATLDDSTRLTPKTRPYVTTVYTLYVEDVNGCGLSSSVKLNVDGFKPDIAPFTTRDLVCPDGYTQLFANVSQQPCGLAQMSCVGGLPQDVQIGTGTIASVAPTPFYNVATSAGERMQVLYRRDELLAMGIKAGFINSMAFNIPTKGSTDSFYGFTIKMGCTPDASLSGSSMNTYTNLAQVFGPVNYATNNGWNNFSFPIAYYWDGSSNLVVEICWSKVYGDFGGSADPVYASNTTFPSVKYIREYSLPVPGMGDGCGLNTGAPLLSSSRPNTRFNVCIPKSIFRYSWTPTKYLTQPDSANTDVNGIKEATDYKITVTSASNARCKSSDIVSIKVDYSNSVVITPASPYIMCRPGYLTGLSANGSGLKPLRNLPCGPNNTVSCTSETSRVIANPGSSAIYDEPSLHPFDGTSATAHTQYIIPRALLRNGNITSGTIRSIEMEAVSGSSMDFKNLKISLACTDLEQFNATAPIKFETGTTPVYSSSSEVFTSGGYHKFNFSTPYNWDTTKNLLIDICYGQAVPGTGLTIKTYNASGFNLMMKSYQTTGDVCLNPSTEIGPAVSQVLPVFRINYCDAGDTDFVYRWTPGDYFQDSVLQNPIVRVDSSVKIYVRTMGRNGCLVSDSTTIIIPANKRSVTPDAQICLGDGIQLRSYNGVKTRWYESKGLTGGTYDKPTSLSCDTCERTIANPKETTTYYAAITSEDNCTDTFRTSVTVGALPGVRIVNKDTTIKYGQSVLLNAFGAAQYYWTPIAGVTNANIASTMVQPLVTTTYVVTGTGVNGCKDRDSVKITVDYRSPVSVPSAFSPNGDGKNDVFRLVGVTFQTLMEFRIFNRWGQEVFSTNNINDGWNGTFNGKDADMGIYTYIIRVGYPDGTAETLKGDVNLIR